MGGLQFIMLPLPLVFAGGVDGAGLLWVINADGSDACVVNTAWRLMAPRIALQAAELRQVALIVAYAAHSAADTYARPVLP